MDRRKFLVGAGGTALALGMNGPARAQMVSMKCVIVGEHNVGKTSALISYTENAFPGEYIPTVFDNYQTNVLQDDQPVSLHFWDTPGSEDYDRLRPQSYPGADVVIVAYSTFAPASLERVLTRWMPELNHHLPGVPKLLVGMKSDLRDVMTDPRYERTTTEEGQEVADRGGLDAFRECSALTQDNLSNTMSAAIDLGLGRDPDRSPFLGERVRRPIDPSLVNRRRPMTRPGGRGN